MSTTSSRFRLALVAGAMTLVSLHASAQQRTAPTQPRPAASASSQAQRVPLRSDLTPTKTPWTKTCGRDKPTGKDLCYTSRDFGVIPDHPPVLMVSFYDTQGDTKLLRILMPEGLMLQPGFAFSVDGGQPTQGVFVTCLHVGCYAEARVKRDVVDAVKKGVVMSVFVTNQGNALVAFNLPLKGFGPAYDGPGKPKVEKVQPAAGK
jgi:invasion protein IalB